jgi:2',3'-cyclic-nucleotide 2'-phosphodiesterase (5'-nucleotidase family)
MHGTPIANFSYGRPVIAAVNTFGIDAAAIGHDEFEWTVDTLRARVREADYRFVAANITDSTGRVPDWAEPWTLITRGGAKVAVIGLITRSTPPTTRPQNVAGLMFGDLSEAVRRVLPAARATADFVIVRAHEGAGEMVNLARALDSGSVDLIVAGHTHQRVDTVVRGIPVIQAGSSGRAIAVVDFIRAAGGGRHVRAWLETPWADAVTPDRDLAKALAREQRGVDSLIGRTVATLKVGLRREGDEYPLGRLLADAFRNIGRADVGLVTNDGIRANLAAGSLSYGALFDALPFQNRLVRIALTGAVLREALERALEPGTPTAHVSGLRVTYDPRRPAGQRISRIRLLNGRPLDPRRTYTLAVQDVVAAGGDDFGMLTAWPSTDAGLTDLGAVIGYLSVLGQPVKAPADERFHREVR